MIWLARCSILHLLRKHYREIFIPEAVFTEAVTRGLEKGYQDADAIKKAVGEGWIKARKARKKYIDQVKAVETEIGIQLGAGERETLALALDTPHPVVLTNDEDAYLIARLLKTRAKGVLYLLIKSVKEGYLTKHQAREHMGKMLENGFWLTPSVVHVFHEALDKL